MRAEITIEFEIDESACAENGISAKDVLDSVGARDNDVSDGYEILPNIRGIDETETFFIKPGTAVVKNKREIKEV